MPKCVFYEIGEGDDGAVGKLVGDNKVFLVKECREVPPLTNKVVIGDREVIVINEGIAQGIQINQYG